MVYGQLCQLGMSKILSFAVVSTWFCSQMGKGSPGHSWDLARKSHPSRCEPLFRLWIDHHRAVPLTLTQGILDTGRPDPSAGGSRGWFKLLSMILWMWQLQEVRPCAGRRVTIDLILPPSQL